MVRHRHAFWQHRAAPAFLLAALVLHAACLNVVGQPQEPQTETPSSPPSVSSTSTRWKVVVAKPKSPEPTRQPIAQFAPIPPAPQATAEPTSSDSDERALLEESVTQDVAEPRTASLEPLIDASPMTDGRYWPGKLLDTRPQATSPVVIPFPEGFISIRTGRAVLQLFIDEVGSIDRIDVLEIEGPVEFADLAKRTLQSTRFSPGLKDHMAVRSTIKIEIAFQRDDPING